MFNTTTGKLARGIISKAFIKNKGNLTSPLSFQPNLNLTTIAARDFHSSSSGSGNVIQPVTGVNSSGAMSGSPLGNQLIHSRLSSAVVGMRAFHYSLKLNYNQYDFNDGSENRLELPPPKDPSKKTLVLDLDEVLATSESDETTLPTYEAMGYTMVKREGIDEFLIEMAKHYEIVLLTSSVKGYADITIGELPDVFEHRLYRHDIPDKDCLKHVSLMGRGMDRIILIDDSPHHLKVNPDNQVLMPSINARKSDDHLKNLTEDLLRIARDEISIKDVCHKWNNRSS